MKRHPRSAEPVDMRRGHDGLCALVRGRFSLDPYCGQVFVFVGKRQLAPGADHIMLDATELSMLLGEFELKTCRIVAWEPKRARVA